MKTPPTAFPRATMMKIDLIQFKGFKIRAKAFNVSINAPFKIDRKIQHKRNQKKMPLSQPIPKRAFRANKFSSRSALNNQ